MTKSLVKSVLFALSFAAALGVAAAHADVFEVVSAPIADGVTVEQMRAADAPVGIFVSKLPGFISRENGVSVKEDGISPGNEWFVIVRWDTIEHAQEAAKLLGPTPEAAGMMKTMQADKIFFRHYEVLQ